MALSVGFDSLDINDGTVYTVMSDAYFGATSPTFNEYRSYTGDVAQFNVSSAQLVQMVIPMRVAGTSEADLYANVAALNAIIASCSSASPKELVFDGVTYYIVASPQIAAPRDIGWELGYCVHVDMVLNRLPAVTGTPGGGSGTLYTGGVNPALTSVADYGATGNGVTDDTDAITDAVADGGRLYFPPGTYLVSDTIPVTDDYTHLDGHGAVILLSDSPVTTNDFDHTCRVFDCQDRTGVSISGFTFREPASATAYSAIAFETGVVRLHDSVGCEVSSCRFEFDGFATGQTNFLSAVWVEGTAADDNRITDNYCLGAAIEYAYNGPCRTTVRGNTVVNSAYNGISGHCGSNAGTDNLVESNFVVAPARMGIEDWGEYMARTTIRGNTITDTGTSLTSGYGISCESAGGVVENNVVVDFEDYGIEGAGDNQRISGNVITQSGAAHLDTGEGIIVNATADAGQHIVSGNRVTRADKGIHLYEWGDCLVEGNVIVDPASKGVTADPNSSTSLTVVVRGNTFRVTAGCSVERHLLECIAQLGAGDVAYEVHGNTFVYDAAADSGTNYEIAAVIAASGTGFIGNVVNGGGITYSGTAPQVTANGTTPDKVRLIGNRMLGGSTIVQTGMTNQVDSGNTA